MNLPNKLTVFRVCCIPFFIFFMLFDAIPYHYFIALFVFAIASVTDWFDGRIARKRNLITNFGKFMDPLADKLLVCAALICLIVKFDVDNQINHAIFTVTVIIIISRELFISGFRILAADQNIVLAAGWWGKFKTASQMFMTIFVILFLQFSEMEIIPSVVTIVFYYISWVFVWISLALTIISMIDYVVKNRKVLKN